MKKLIILLVLLPFFMEATSQVWTYEYPDTLVFSALNGRNYRSFMYRVQVRQDDSLHDSYVLADYNTFPDGQRDKMTEWNHSTTFSFEGSVQVEIMKKDSSAIGSCRVYPLALEIPWTIENGNKLVISLDESRKIFVEMEGMNEHPLFVFADPPEENIPDPEGEDVQLITTGMSAQEVRDAINLGTKPVIFFEKGIHSYGDQTDNSYPGYQLPIRSDRTYYIPGGACIIGSFLGDGVSNTSFRGRGIITACGKERLAQAESIPYNLIYFNGGGSAQVVEGLTFTNPAHFVLLSRGTLSARNLKMFGWWHQTDGFGGEEGSSFHDGFIKVNDDFVKVYRNGQRYSNLVIYKQINGAAFQFGWNQYGAASNCKIWDIYIVKDDDKTPGATSNTAVISLVNNDGSTISNNSFENIYIENDVQRTVGIRVRGGSFTGLTVSNLQHLGKDRAQNYLVAGEGGTIKGISFYQNYYGEDCMRSKEDYNMRFEGSVSNIWFVGCPEDPSSAIPRTGDTDPFHITFMDDPGMGGTLHIALDPGFESAVYSLFTLSGQLIDAGNIRGPQHSIRLDYPGLYLFRLNGDRAGYTGKYLIR